MTQPSDGWQYRTFQWRDCDGDFEAWVQGIKDDGWKMWEAGPGAWCSVDGRRTFNLSVRQWVARPFSTRPRVASGHAGGPS